MDTSDRRIPAYASTREASPTVASAAQPSRPGRLLFIAKAALVTGLAGCIAAANGGSLTLHMTGHIIAMNVAAPAAAWLFLGARHKTGSKGGLHRLLIATALQLFVFFLWHSPPAMALSMQSPVARLGMLFTLFAVSSWFWSVIFEAVARNRFEAVGALLLTGKLVCLIAVLFVFAPRFLYPGMGHGGAMHMAMMGDQQLAGLLMLSACPLTYVGACIYIVATWLSRLSGQNDGREAQ